MADLVCKKLGYLGGTLYTYGVDATLADLPIVTGYKVCDGSEAEIWDCRETNSGSSPRDRDCISGCDGSCDNPENTKCAADGTCDECASGARPRPTRMTVRWAGPTVAFDREWASGPA